MGNRCKQLNSISLWLKFSRKFILILGLIGILVFSPFIQVHALGEITFTAQELVGRPTASSITLLVIPDSEIELFYELGTAPGDYSIQTEIQVAPGGQPHETLIDGLEANTRYYYRMQYCQPGLDWIERPEHSFQTQRSQGAAFTFTVVSDSHLNESLGDASLYQRTLLNIQADRPDFDIDLGDAFFTDGMTTSQQVNQVYLSQKPYLDQIGHTSPIFLALGNHENEEGWNLDDTGDPATSRPVMSANARKMYYLNPVPNSFYSGNTDASIPEITGDHLREDYYAWEWGDALFIVIDPFWYTMRKPYPLNIGGEDNDETPSFDNWDWTLGQQQFNWFKETLENSSAHYKFVFSHHMTGGMNFYGRGGAQSAHLFEWGGYNSDETTWGFELERPGWGSQAIQQLMSANHVSIFFHGHDHEFAYEERDGVAYQLVPMPSDNTYGYGFNTYNELNEHTIRVLPNSGHLRVSVSPTGATVEYVRSFLSGGTNGEVAYAYTVSPDNVQPDAQPDQAETTLNASIELDVLANDTDADGDPLSISTISNPAHGSAAILPGQTILYTPDLAFVGQDSFTYTIQDAYGESDSATVSLATSLPVEFQEEIGSGVLKDPLAPSLVITTTAAVKYGDTIVIAYVSDPGEGLDIQVTDDGPTGDPYSLVAQAVSDSHLQVYLFTAYCTGELPVGSAISITSSVLGGTLPSARAAVVGLFSGLAQNPLDQQLGNPLAGQTNPPLDSTPFVGPTGLTSFGHELLVGLIGTEGPPEDEPGLWGNGFDPVGRIGTSGEDDLTNVTASFGYKIVDVTGAFSATKTAITPRYWAAGIATLKASAQNSPPYCQAIHLATTEDTLVESGLQCLDLEGSGLSYEISTQPLHGSAQVNSGQLVYTPDRDWNGSDQFSYRAVDGVSDGQPATVTVSVSAVQDPPVAVDDPRTSDEDVPLQIDVLANDLEVDGDPLSISAYDPTSLQGGLVICATECTYTPPLNYHGSDQFAYTISDGQGGEDSATVELNILSVNDRPLADDQSLQTAEDTPLTLNLTGSDLDGDPLSYFIQDPPSHGFLSGLPPYLTYNPAVNYSGADSFTFWVNDGMLDSLAATVDLTIQAINDAPFAQSQDVITLIDTPIAINLVGSDVESSPLSYTIIEQPGHGDLSGVAPDLTYTPETGYVGSDSFTFAVNDGLLDSLPALVQITIYPLLVAPGNLQASPISSTRIDLSWQDNSDDESQFRIERSPDGLSGWQEIGSVPAGTTSYSNTGLSCETGYHYRVRAYRSSDGEFSDYSTSASATTYACQSLSLVPGWNLITLPLNPLVPFTSETILQNLQSQGIACVEIMEWLNGGWNSHEIGLPFGDFPLALGRGYFVRCNLGGAWRLEGSRLDSGTAVALSPGWNLVGIPHPESGYQAHTVLDEINNQGATCGEIMRWYNSGWESYLPGIPINDFDILPYQGYFVQCSAGGSYTPAGVPSLALPALSLKGIQHAKQNP